jgi:CubicO group peptidase (beta-lactamase class C family)
MKYLLTFFSLLLLITTLSAQPLERKVDVLNRYIEEARQYWEVPGMSVAIVKDGEVLLAKGYGERELGSSQAVNKNTIFNIGSTTKAFTAVLIGMLVDEGKLDWDDKVVDHMPEFQLEDPYVTREVRVKDLLSHNTGLGNADYLWASTQMTQREILERLRHLPLSYPLRGGYTYQNIMYHAAGLLIEKKTGISWEENMQSKIFDRLGMTNTYPDKELSQVQRNRSTAHHYVDGAITPIEDFNCDSIAAAGATWSSISDMAKWSMFLLDSAKVDGQRLLKEKTWMELFKPQAIIPQDQFYPTVALTQPKWTTYGLGFFQHEYEGKNLDFHTGSLPGTIAMIGLMHEEKLGYYFLGNLDHAEVRHALMYQVFDMLGNTGARHDWSKEMKALYDGLDERSRKSRAALEARRVTGTSPSKSLTDYAGSYGHPVWGNIRIAEQDGKLMVRQDGQESGYLQHWHYDTFQWIPVKKWQSPSYITFGQNNNGKIVELSFGQNYVFTKI